MNRYKSKDRVGTTSFGFLISENEQAIVLKELSGEKVSINKKDIKERIKQEHSLCHRCNNEIV
jgi:hypothetical protein